MICIQGAFKFMQRQWTSWFGRCGSGVQLKERFSVLKEQLDVKKEVLNNTARELDALQASIIFARDGKS